MNIKQKMQKLRIDAFKEFAKEVQSGKFPSKEYEVDVSDDVYTSFCEELDKFN